MDPTQPSGNNGRHGRPGSQPGSPRTAGPSTANAPPAPAVGSAGQPPSPDGGPARNTVPNPTGAPQAAPPTSPHSQPRNAEGPRVLSRAGSTHSAPGVLPPHGEPAHAPTTDAPRPRSTSDLTTPDLNRIGSEWAGMRSQSQRRETIQPAPALRIMGFLRDSAECYKALREQVTLAETEVNDQLAVFEREMRELAQQGTDPTIGPENNVEDVIDATQVEAQLAAPPSPSPSEVLRQQMEADRLERLRRAGLGDNGPVAGPSRLLPPSPLAAPAPIRAAPPRRSVAFGAFEPSNITAPPGWDHYESASQAPRGDRIPVTSTAPPHQFVLWPRRSLAPGASAHHGLSSVPEHELERSNELAYTGPSYGPRAPVVASFVI